MTTHSTDRRMNIKIDLTKDSLFDELGLKRLKESYMMVGEVSPQERYAYVSNVFATDDAHAQQLYNHSSSHWLSYATPELAYGRNKTGLPISCFLAYLPDTSRGLLDTFTEVNTLSMLGGGVGIHMNIRSADSKSTGIMPHLKTYDAAALAYKQGSTRRGSYAAYLDISHPEIVPFIEMRKATGDQNIRCANLNHGVNITDDFMQIIEKCMIDPLYDDTWPLIDPHSKEVISTVSAKYLWQLLIETRHQRGEPYMHFIDTANAAVMPFQKALGLKINGSNLCMTGDTIIQIKIDNNSEIEDIRLDEFVTKYEYGYYTDVLVKTHDSTMVSWSKISAAAQTGIVDELYEIESPNGNIIRCTAEHKIFTKNRGYIEAQHLVETDELLEI